MQIKINRKRRRQATGLAVGAFMASISWVLLSAPENEQYLALGPMNTGHEDLECSACHTKARGNVLQQVQANIMYLTGAREQMADFGLGNVDNKKCLDCHNRPNDRHPVHRFLEPKFADAREAINPHMCESCHREHKGRRFTIVNTGYCVNCHSDLKMKNDPLDLSHEQLIAREMWSTCLQCHDFHGNHLINAPQQMRDTIPADQIMLYIKGGRDPYGDRKKYAVRRNEKGEYIEVNTFN